ncbi:MAG: VTT domain-containing protein [Gammaproteobacteria bacterium]
MTRSPKGDSFGSAWRVIAASVLFVAAVLGLLVVFDMHDQVLRLLRWFDAQGAWAALLFVAVMAAVVVLLVPGVLFTTGAGFVFGVIEGTIYVVTGTLIGAVMAFLAARHLFGQRARRFVLKRSRLRLLSDQATRHGWKIVLFTRMIPFFPSKISNYFFGLTPFSLRGYIGGSLLGFIPYSLHNVYIGSLAADLSIIGARDLSRSPLEWAVYLTGFVVAVIAVVYCSRLARRALARYEAQGEIEEESA